MQFQTLTSNFSNAQFNFFHILFWNIIIFLLISLLLLSSYLHFAVVIFCIFEKSGHFSSRIPRDVVLSTRLFTGREEIPERAELKGAGRYKLCAIQRRGNQRVGLGAAEKFEKMEKKWPPAQSDTKSLMSLGKTTAKPAKLKSFNLKRS